MDKRVYIIGYQSRYTKATIINQSGNQYTINYIAQIQ